MDREYFLQRVEHLHEQGQSIRAIAAALGVNRGRVERAIKISALRSRYRPGQQGESRRSNIFVGRQREMESLQTTLEEALAGQGRLAQPFERHFRDAHVLLQHSPKSSARYGSAGRLMFGLDHDWVWLSF